MLKLYYLFPLLLVSGNCQDTETDSSCNSRPVVYYHFGPAANISSNSVDGSTQENISQGRPGKIGPRGEVGHKGQKVSCYNVKVKEVKM